jgi:glucans biosynthesis protein
MPNAPVSNPSRWPSSLLSIGAGALALCLPARSALADARQEGPSPAAPADGALGAPFDLDHLRERAARLAEAEPRVLEVELPGALAELDYDGYRRIDFRPEARLWAGAEGGFTLDLMHLGSLFRIPVRMHEVEGGRVRELPFRSGWFEYRSGSIPPLEGLDLGYSGFRLRSPLNRPDESSEFLVFQGASYFRGIGRNQAYGSSARGLAIRTADPEGEEFPAFTEFWLERPEPGSTQARFHGLLESRSVVGLYTFVTTPGDETLVEVEATLYPRVELDRVGLAPLTSMFLFDERNRRAFDDFRGAVCDANGLQMVTGASRRIWRPLDNPESLQVSAFVDQDPQGFGLVQRRRDFATYGDLEARYERRPSVWVEPIGAWGKGAVVLVEIPMGSEFNDNIVAFWRPEAPLQRGQPFAFAYRLRWCDQPPDGVPLARVEATRTGLAPNTGRRLIVIDFSAAEGLPEGPFEVSASCSQGNFVDVRLERLPVEGMRRVTLEFEPGDAQLSEMSVFLRQGETPISETWLHRWIRT